MLGIGTVNVVLLIDLRND